MFTRIGPCSRCACGEPTLPALRVWDLLGACGSRRGAAPAPGTPAPSSGGGGHHRLLGPLLCVHIVPKGFKHNPGYKVTGTTLRNWVWRKLAHLSFVSNRATVF